jgi:flagellar motor protein MotB
VILARKNAREDSRNGIGPKQDSSQRTRRNAKGKPGLATTGLDRGTRRLFVVGHTDTIGDPAMNLKLSQARAQSVVSALTTKHGIPASRLFSFGAGPYAPIASNKDEEGRAKNRRVELVDMAGE